MKAFRIGDCIIVADLENEAVQFFCEETSSPPSGPILEIGVEEIVPESGLMIKDIINQVMDERSAWLRMGVPVELHWPFFVRKKADSN
jgi:hypothetical protein